MMASRGVCLWLTGRSGAGKSTVTKELLLLLHKHGRTVTVLDVVPYLSKAWFEKTSEPKLLRKAYVAAEIARHGGIAVCVTVSARRKTRASARELVGSDNFVEIFVDAPADICRARKESRNRKPPFIKRARAFSRRMVRSFSSGRRSSYEPPLSPEIVIDTCNQSPQEGARTILQYLIDRGFVNDEECGGRTHATTAIRESQVVSAFKTPNRMAVK